MSDSRADDEFEWRCYRHPDRDAGVRCRRCERAICPDCMVTAPVGFQCPECVRRAPAVHTARSWATPSRGATVVTAGIVALNLAVFVVGLGGGDGGRAVALDFGLFGPSVADGEWYRILTSGVVHGGLVHVGFNSVILWQLGSLLEPVLGRVRFALLYLAALVGGSVGVLLLSPDALTVGASGAVFGLMGAAVVGLRSRGIDAMQTGLGGLLAINLVLTFVLPNISIGGHLGGLVTGAGLGGVLLAEGDTPMAKVRGGALAAGAAAALFGIAQWLAANPL